MKYEVMVIDNQASTSLAYWTEIFDSLEEAKEYGTEVYQQMNMYNSKADGPENYVFNSIVIFEDPNETVTPIRISEVSR